VCALRPHAAAHPAFDQAAAPPAATIGHSATPRRPPACRAAGRHRESKAFYDGGVQSAFYDGGVQSAFYDGGVQAARVRDDDALGPLEQGGVNVGLMLRIRARDHEAPRLEPSHEDTRAIPRRPGGRVG
jgi:hypothetical protein